MIEVDAAARLDSLQQLRPIRRVDVGRREAGRSGPVGDGPSLEAVDDVLDAGRARSGRTAVRRRRPWWCRGGQVCVSVVTRRHTYLHSSTHAEINADC